MRRLHPRLDHRPAAVGLAALAIAMLAPPAAAGQRLSLPTEADAVAVAAGAEEILFGPEGIERVLPGPVRDVEDVLVEVAPGGEPVRVRVEQWLTLTGLGDYRFRVPGPARSVEALPGSEADPGLRRGSMLWQGFSPGERRLAAIAELDPEEEATRLPLRIAELSMTIDGRRLQVGETGSGELELSLVVENVSEIPIQIATGPVDPQELAQAVGAVRGALESGERPRPGAAGVPSDLRLVGPTDVRIEQVEAPFRVEGELSFAPGTVEIDEVSGAEVAQGTDGTLLRFASLLGGGEPARLEVRASGSVSDAALPALAMTAVPAPPSPAMLGEDLDPLMDVLWRVARLRQYDGYLGNPDPTGPAETVYRFALAAAAPSAAPVAPPDVRGFGPLGLLAAMLALALVLVAAGLLWAHS